MLRAETTAVNEWDSLKLSLLLEPEPQSMHVHCVPEKSDLYYISNNFKKSGPVSIIFGTGIAKESPVFTYVAREI